MREIRRLVPVLVLLLIAGLLPAVPAHAAEPVRPPETAEHELTPFLGLKLGGRFSSFTDPAVESLDIDDSVSFGFVYGFPVGEGMLEILLSRQTTNASGEGDLFTSRPNDFRMTVDNALFGGTYAWDGRGRAQPFVGVWLGAARFEVPELDQDLVRFAFSAGAGAKVRLAPHLDLRLQGRWTGSPIASDTSIFCSSAGSCFVSSEGTILGQVEVSAGLTFRFGS